MFEAIFSALASRARARARRAGITAALAAAATTLVIIAISAGLIALFFWLEFELSPIDSALAIAAGALVLAALVSVPLWWPRRKPPPPPPEPTLAQFVALIARNGALTPRQMATGAVLGALALGLMSGAKRKEDGA